MFPILTRIRLRRSGSALLVSALASGPTLYAANVEDIAKAKPPFPSSRKRNVFAALSIAAALATSSCFADQWPNHPLPTKSSEAAAYGHAIGIRPSLGVCLKAADGTTPGIRDCLRDEHGFQDHRLNQTYKKLMGSLNETDRKRLREEERRWIAFRDKFCTPDSEPGQGQELESYECLVDQTADRATELESRLDRK